MSCEGPDLRGLLALLDSDDCLRLLTCKKGHVRAVVQTQ